MRRADGSWICDEKTPITTRRATDAEHEEWLRGRVEDSYATAIARSEYAIYLIPVIRRSNPIHIQWCLDALPEVARRARAERIGGPLLELELRLEAIDMEIAALKFRQRTPLPEALQRQYKLLAAKRRETKALLALLWEADEHTKQ